MAVFGPASRATYDPAFAGEGQPFGAGVKLPAPSGLGVTEAGPAGPSIQYNAQTKEISVNGFRFKEEDHQSALQSESYLTQARKQPEGTGWTLLPQQAYDEYLNKIKDPSLGRFLSKQFGTAVDSAQLMGGAALSFVGAEETGAGIIEQQTKEIGYNAPYEFQFTDVKGPGDFAWWIAGNAASLAPIMIETALTALAGALIGGIGGGLNPFTAIGGAVLSVTGRKAIIQAALLAAKKQVRGEALDKTEEKLLREVSGITAEYMAAIKPGQPGFAAASRAWSARLAGETPALGAKAALKGDKLLRGRAGGAVAASGVNSYGIGIGDIYSEVLETGEGSRAATAFAAVPYAMLDLAPEMLLARYFLKAASGVGKAQALKRGTVGGIAGGAAEGSTEAMQEVAILMTTGQFDLENPEIRKRLINSFAAGAGIGGPLGAGANLYRGEPVNLLASESPGSSGPGYGSTPGTVVDSKPLTDPDNLMDPPLGDGGAAPIAPFVSPEQLELPLGGQLELPLEGGSINEGNVELPALGPEQLELLDDTQDTIRNFDADPVTPQLGERFQEALQVKNAEEQAAATEAQAEAAQAQIEQAEERAEGLALQERQFAEAEAAQIALDRPTLQPNLPGIPVAPAPVDLKGEVATLPAQTVPPAPAPNRLLEQLEFGQRGNALILPEGTPSQSPRQPTKPLSAAEIQGLRQSSERLDGIKALRQCLRL